MRLPGWPGEVWLSFVRLGNFVVAFGSMFVRGRVISCWMCFVGPMAASSAPFGKRTL